MSAFDSIRKGFAEAKAHAEVRDLGAHIYEIDLPKINVSEIGATTGLSQSELARSVGVAKGTLLNWEQGRRIPNGPA